jgi:hypothetical protein
MMVMQNNYHNVRLEWIVIWLIVVEVVVGESTWLLVQGRDLSQRHCSAALLTSQVTYIHAKCIQTSHLAWRLMRSVAG